MRHLCLVSAVLALLVLGVACDVEATRATAPSSGEQPSKSKQTAKEDGSTSEAEGQHSPDSIAKENSGTRGRSIWVHSS